MQWQGVQRLMFGGMIWAAAVLGVLGGLAAEIVGPKSPVPAEAAKKEALTRLRQVYGVAYEKAQSPEDKLALAGKLLAKAEQMSDDTAAAFALFIAARELAVQSVAADAAFRAVDKMAERFVIDAPAAKVEVVRKLAESSGSSKQLVSLATLADDLTGELIAADRFDEADEMHKMALTAAKACGSRELQRQVLARLKPLKDAKKVYESIRSRFADLEQKPVDPEANLAVGEYLCYVKGDWDRGLPMLALGSNESLAKVARKDLEGVSDAEGQAALGEAWWKLAESETGVKRRQFQSRAEHWYREALGQLSGPAKETVSARLAEMDQAKASTSPAKDASRLAKNIADNYLALAIQGKGKDKKEKAAAWEIRADNSLSEDGRPVGTWSVNESQLSVKFSDAVRATATIRLKKKDPFLGTITFQDGEVWNCELHRASVVAVWQHRVGNEAPVRLRVWSNGYFDQSGGLGTWGQSGSRLTLQWPNGDGAICTLSREGRSYTGQDQRGARVHGVLADP